MAGESRDGGRGGSGGKEKGRRVWMRSRGDSRQGDHETVSQDLWPKHSGALSWRPQVTPILPGSCHGLEPLGHLGPQQMLPEAF